MPGTLVKSNEILRDFQILTERASFRIRLNDLASKLDLVDEAGWVFECSEQPQVFSKDRRSIVPLPEQSTIKVAILDAVSKKPATLTDLADSYEMATDSMTLLVEQWRSELGGDQLVVSQNTENPYLYGSTFRCDVEAQIQALITRSDGSQRVRIELEAPWDLVLEVAENAVHNNVLSGGRIEVSGDELHFVPDGLEEAENRKSTVAYEQQVDRQFQLLTLQGWCSIPTEAEIKAGMVQQTRHSVMNAVCTRYGDESGDAQGLIILEGRGTSDEARLELWEAEALSKRIETMKTTAIDSINTWWRSRTDNRTEADTLHAFKESLCNDREWIGMVSETEHITELENTITDLFTGMERKDSQTFQEMVKSELLVIMELHLAGIQSTVDIILRQHLAEFLADHLKHKTCPVLLETLHARRLLTPKQRARDADKFRGAVHEAKNLEEVKDAITKWTKKLKISPPTRLELHAVQMSTLRGQIKAMRSMTRASDLLQNVIWVLLAEGSRHGGHDALFVSPGRDTSRMIKQYHVVGDASTAGKLEGWRDVLKAGKEGSRELREMWEMANEAVARMEGEGPA